MRQRPALWILSIMDLESEGVDLARMLHENAPKACQSIRILTYQVMYKHTQWSYTIYL